MKSSFSSALVLAFCLPTVSAHCEAATAAKPATSSPKITPAAAQKMVERVLKETSAIRQLPIKHAVPSGVKTRAEIEKMVGKQIETGNTPGQLRGEEIYLKQVGLAPANFDLKSYYTHMMGEQIAGYYDTKAKTFYTSELVSPLLLETVMAHELTHALQDQDLNLQRLDKWPEHDSDARLAMSSLVEGDATLAMSRYMSANPLRFLGALSSSLQAQGSSQALQNGPRVLAASLEFPYIKGLAFASELYKRGGWKSVDGAFQKLPQSTEQIIHFDKYLAGEAPVKVPLRDVTPQLGQGWKLLDHDVNGELGLQLIVAEHLGDYSAAESAAAGWAGDRYEIYGGPGKGVLIVQDTVWDNEAEARQWREAYARSTGNRFKIKPQQRGMLQVWNAAPNGVWMEQRGKRVLILEGTVGAFNADVVLKRLWR
jgi:hypothetical protein